MNIESIIKKLELIKVLIETDDELSRFDFSGFTKCEYTKENTYTIYKKRKTHNGEQIFNFQFQYSNRKGINEGTDKFNKIVMDKWNRYKKINKVDIYEIKKLWEMLQMEN